MKHMLTLLPNYTTRMGRTVVGVLLAALLVGCAGEPPPTSSLPTPASNSSSPLASSIGSYGSPTLGLTLDETLQVVDVQQGSAAEQAGIQRGDVLVKIGSTTLEAGTSSATLVTLVRNVIASQTQQPLQFTLLRGGQEIAVAVLPITPNATPNQPTPTAVPADQVYF